MQIVNILDAPSQTLNINLSGQFATINLWTRQTGLYMDLYVNNVLIIGGVICQNLNQIVRDAYLGFIGDLMFFDTQGVSDPFSPGLGTRFLLIYVLPSDFP